MTRLTARPMKVMWLFLVACLLAACAAQQLPKGYESLRSEATILEVSKYYQGLRNGYVQARTAGVLPPAQFVLAVKADESFVAVWNTYLEAVKAKQDTTQMWSAVVNNLGILEGLIRAWVPADVFTKKPAVLGGT